MLDGWFGCKKCDKLHAVIEGQMQQFSELMSLHQQMMATQTEIKQVPRTKMRPESWSQKRKALEKKDRLKRQNDNA